ncbi:melanoma-associated antigen D2 [Episyrphus balteatus]|uniref:melanoma-associated antigen D2 n=1 Tax=Episyrphus balteatus TaxID=286459 RepID=UPI002486A043|nr:melanoma-associated antigen D2 [Episyrphus balteatus]
MEVDEENLSDNREHRNNVIHYILNNSSSKYPLKNSEIISRALNGKSSLLSQVIGDVRDALENTYGILLKTVPDTKSGKLYICVSKFAAVTSNEFDELQRSQITLLFIVLSYIFMRGVPVSEEFLEEFLKGLHIYFDKSHPFFGSNIKKLITETFVKQLYLKKTKSEKDAVENELFYSWGYRSEVEFPKKDVLDAVSKLLSKPAKHFVLQNMQANAPEPTD